MQTHKSGVLGNVMETVSTVTIQQLIETYGEIDLLKIDVEGAEYDIILNTDNSLFEKINNIFVECHFFEKDYKQKYTDVLNKLRLMGYEVEEYKPNQFEDAGGSECVYARNIK
jgi:hypothetical protein